MKKHNRDALPEYLKIALARLDEHHQNIDAFLEEHEPRVIKMVGQEHFDNAIVTHIDPQEILDIQAYLKNIEDQNLEADTEDYENKKYYVAFSHEHRLLKEEGQRRMADVMAARLLVAKSLVSLIESTIKKFKGMIPEDDIVAQRIAVHLKDYEAELANAQKEVMMTQFKVAALKPEVVN